MGKFSKKRSLWIAGGIALLLGLSVYFVFDAFSPLHRFRTTQDDIASTEKVDLTGLRELNASGGTAPHLADLQKKLSHITQEKLIIDAKSESPGYIDGRPLSFFRYGLSGPRLPHLIRRVYYTGTIFERPDLVISAPEATKNYGFGYTSVHIGSRFVTADENIDEIVALLESIHPNVWVHVHCLNGAGRTSMLLAMLDIMRNAPTVSIGDIVKRQHLLGSVDLFNTVVWSKGSSYNQEQLEDRKKFIENFYDFIVQRKAGGIQLWSEWNRLKNEKKM
jgi:hypothetical protein